jgi:hypothetical protein
MNLNHYAEAKIALDEAETLVEKVNPILLFRQSQAISYNLGSGIAELEKALDIIDSAIRVYP